MALCSRVPAAGAGCPALQGTAAEGIWPQPWQKGGISLLLAVARVLVAHGHAHFPAVPNLGARFAGICSVAAKWPQRSGAKLSRVEKGLWVTEVRG